MRIMQFLICFLLGSIFTLSCKKELVNGIQAANSNINWTTYNTWNSNLLNNTVFGIAIDKQENLWFATENGVSKFDGTLWTNYTPANSGLIANPVVSIVIDKQGNKWFGTYYGVSVLHD
jgi:ligand-binding sensor domain-containing protein